MFELLFLVAFSLLLPVAACLGFAFIVVTLRRRTREEFRKVLLLAAVWGGTYVMWMKFAPYGAIGDPTGAGQSPIVYPISLVIAVWTCWFLLKALKPRSDTGMARPPQPSRGSDAT